mmetsp:Transcript_3470/g.7235  ORF Transcript_3470/g.7235 Transcript_3470/m.7235 type:complete len:264 (-) Transcript_3470:535-1326(-)
MVVSGHAFSNGGFHETGQRGEDVDGREDALCVELTVEIDLSLSNISSQIGNRMRDIIVRHRQDGQLRDRSVPAHHTPSPLVNCGQIRVHVPGITTPSRHLLPRRGHLAQRICVGTHVRQNHEHVQVPLVRQVLRRRQRQPRRDDALDGRVVSQVEEEGRALHGTALLEIGAEEPSRFHVHTHGPENDGEVLLVRVNGIFEFDEGGLTGDLGSHLIVGKSSGGEDGDLLPAGDRVHDVDGGDAGLDHGLGVVAGRGVDGLAVDV